MLDFNGLGDVHFLGVSCWKSGLDLHGFCRLGSGYKMFHYFLAFFQSFSSTYTVTGAAGAGCFFRMWSTGTGCTNCGLWLFDDEDDDCWESPRRLDAGDSRLCTGVVAGDLATATGLKGVTSLPGCVPMLLLDGTIFDWSWGFGASRVLRTLVESTAGDLEATGAGALAEETDDFCPEVEDGCGAALVSTGFGVSRFTLDPWTDDWDWDGTAVGVFVCWVGTWGVLTWFDDCWLFNDEVFWSVGRGASRRTRELEARFGWRFDWLKGRGGIESVWVNGVFAWLETLGAEATVGVALKLLLVLDNGFWLFDNDEVWRWLLINGTWFLFNGAAVEDCWAFFVAEAVLVTGELAYWVSRLCNGVAWTPSWVYESMTLPVAFFWSSFFSGSEEMSGVFLSSIGDANAKATMVNKINCERNKNCHRITIENLILELTVLILTWLLCECWMITVWVEAVRPSIYTWTPINAFAATLVDNARQNLPETWGKAWHKIHR